MKKLLALVCFLAFAPLSAQSAEAPACANGPVEDIVATAQAYAAAGAVRSVRVLTTAETQAALGVVNPNHKLVAEDFEAAVLVVVEGGAYLYAARGGNVCGRFTLPDPVLVKVLEAMDGRSAALDADPFETVSRVFRSGRFGQIR